MVDVKSKRCINCDITQVKTSRYKDHCFSCFLTKFPNEIIIRNYRNKEVTVFSYIVKTFPQFVWINDKKLENCRRRPDIITHFQNSCIMIEIDEFQHSNYYDEDERLLEISTSLDKPYVLIRFNPDSYIENDNRVESCWKINEQGLCTLKNDEDWNVRLDTLKDEINKHLLNQSITIVNLFYDS
jgi:hypothetical protein